MTDYATNSGKIIVSSKSAIPASNSSIATGQPPTVGHAKIILLGEHAAVFGRHIIAAPIPLAIQTEVKPASSGITVTIPAWDVTLNLADRVDDAFVTLQQTVMLILTTLNLQAQALAITVTARIPHSSGLGASAALSVSLIRGLSRYAAQSLTNEAINHLAFACEQIAHERPSGIDNTVATYGQFLLYRKADPPVIKSIMPAVPLNLVIGISPSKSATAQMVAQTVRLWESDKTRYNGIFDEIERLTLKAADAIVGNELTLLGECMNACQQQLAELNVTSPQLDEMIQCARTAGALGAKLTGSGGGGAMIALCCDQHQATRVGDALKQSGYQAMEVNIG